MVGLMERAPLRPVPARPAGPVDPAAAVREVAAALPALEPLEVRVLALVALADRPRAEVAELLGIEEDQVRTLLAATRKELRQTISHLSGSGWCERAEGLISDRLDGAIGETDGRRLDVHLRNCARCVEHERRLVQATDALLAGIAPARPRPAPPTGDAPLTAVPFGGEPAAGSGGGSTEGGHIRRAPSRRRTGCANRPADRGGRGGPRDRADRAPAGRGHQLERDDRNRDDPHGRVDRPDRGRRPRRPLLAPTPLDPS